MAYRRSIDASASEDRLGKLIEERLKAGTKTQEIDDRIWDLFGEEWTVMFTDLSGFSRNVAAFGIIHFLQTIYESERILIPIIEQHDGILLKVEGDSMLVIFRNPCKAIHAALSMQQEAALYNQSREAEEHVLVCIGLGHGRILRIGDTDVFGQEVNAASKLGEDTAKAGEILVTEAVKDRAKDMAGIRFSLLQDGPPGTKSYKTVSG